MNIYLPIQIGKMLCSETSSSTLLTRSSEQYQKLQTGKRHNLKIAFCVN